MFEVDEKQGLSLPQYEDTVVYTNKTMFQLGLSIVEQNIMVMLGDGAYSQRTTTVESSVKS